MKFSSMMKWSLAALVALGALGLSSEAMADVPPTMTHQGRLYDASDAPVSGLVSVEFTFYDAATGGNAVWTETHEIAFD